MKDAKITKRIFILAGIFCIVCLLYIVRLAGIVLTGEKPEIRDHSYVYVTVNAARGQIYDRNGVPLVTNKYVYNLVLDDQTMQDDDYERNKSLLTLLHIFNNSDQANKRTQDLYPFEGRYPELIYSADVFEDSTMRYRLVRRIAANELEDDVKNHTVSVLESHYAEHPEDFPLAEDIVSYYMEKYGLDAKSGDQNLYTDAQINALLLLY